MLSNLPASVFAVVPGSRVLRALYRAAVVCGGLFFVTLSACAVRDRPLQLISGAAPGYPPAARVAGIEGEVLVAYRVTEAGLVEAVEVVRAEPAELFDAAALAAVARFRYRPRLKDGIPVAVPQVLSTIRFRLEDDYRLPGESAGDGASR